MDSGGALLAAESTALWCVAGLEQGTDGGEVRRRASSHLAASYTVSPPALDESDPRCPGADPRYQGLSASELPLTECLKDTVARFLPYWHQTIVPTIRAGKKVVIAAHGNSLRAW